MSEARDYISRTLSWIDDALKTQKVRDQDIVSRFSVPVVILGDPGMGKTWLMEELGKAELGWIVNPARAYLDMFSDLEHKGAPEGRIEEWLGPEIRDAALEGFEAVLHRNDLPTADQIARDYAESRVWNFIYPMLAGAGRRHLAGEGFDGLPAELVSALLLGCEQELLSGREQFDGLEEALRGHLQRNPVAYEAHWRRKMEPMFEHQRTHVQGLYRFVRTESERPLSSKLSREWLERHPNLSHDIERELASALIAPVEAEGEPVADVSSQFVDRGIVKGFDGRFLDSAHHAFGLTVGPGMVRLG